MANSDSNQAKSILGDVLRGIIDQRGLRQKALAAKINITESSLSNILNGKVRPRQVTFTRLIRELEVTPAEQQKLLTAYDFAEMGELPERLSEAESPIPHDEIQRVKRYMEIKSMSVTFQDDVENALSETGRYFERSHRQENLICDFLFPELPRIAVDCKYNLNRDWDRTIASVKLLKDHLDLSIVLIVVPYTNDITLAEENRISRQGGRLVTVAELVDTVNGLLAKERGRDD